MTMKTLDHTLMELEYQSLIKFLILDVLCLLHLVLLIRLDGLSARSFKIPRCIIPCFLFERCLLFSLLTFQLLKLEQSMNIKGTRCTTFPEKYSIMKVLIRSFYWFNKEALIMMEHQLPILSAWSLWFHENSSLIFILKNKSMQPSFRHSLRLDFMTTSYFCQEFTWMEVKEISFTKQVCFSTILKLRW